MKRVWNFWKRYNELIFSSFFIAVMANQWNWVGVFCLALAAHHIRHYINDRECQRQHDLIETLFDIGSSHVSCIEDLAVRLIPFIGDDEVSEILKKHNVEFERAWKTYNGKWPPGPKKNEKQGAKVDDVLNGIPNV